MIDGLRIVQKATNVIDVVFLLILFVDIYSAKCPNGNTFYIKINTNPNAWKIKILIS